MPGPKPKPSALREVDGNAGRRKRNPTEPAPLPPADLTPPAELAGRALEIWQEMAPKIAAMGCLADVDRLHLTTTCRLQALADYWMAQSEADVVKETRRPSPAGWGAQKWQKMASGGWASFGTTGPTSRAHITTGGPTATDPFTAYKQARDSAKA